MARRPMCAVGAIIRRRRDRKWPGFCKEVERVVKRSRVSSSSPLSTWRGTEVSVDCKVQDGRLVGLLAIAWRLDSIRCGTDATWSQSPLRLNHQHAPQFCVDCASEQRLCPCIFQCFQKRPCRHVYIVCPVLILCYLSWLPPTLQTGFELFIYGYLHPGSARSYGEPVKSCATCKLSNASEATAATSRLR